MGAFEEAKEWLVETMGMWWPDADEGKLRDAATAWRDFADTVQDVRQATGGKAGALIENNRGEAIDAFEVFWHRYCHGGRGWLNDLEQAARDMATALDDFANDIEDVKNEIDTHIAISAATIVAGIGLAVVTAGAASGAAVAAATTITRLAASLGVAVSANAARIAATTLTGAAFGGVESVAVNLAVAQPMRIHAGLQDGFNLNQVGDAAKDGMFFGGAFGAGYGTVRSFTGVPWSPRYAELMGTRRSAAARNSPESKIPVPPKTPGDAVLWTGDHVYYRQGSTTVGYDRNTTLNTNLVGPREGYHDVVVHGNNKGYFMPGRTNQAGVDFPPGEVNPTHIAEAVKSNPHYNGEPIRLVSCHSGTVAQGSGEIPAAQALANRLGVPVQAPTDEVGVFPKLPPDRNR
ncbi:WXG100 family type VII secretion target [Streptomyces taklimakanensis]|uniref:WXG100 family type VII secretion target n=1 Tax=Streptomyces taklimakanensis TaxID=2569853 RepID=UPI001EE3A422|nr:WXG100 family type VII secretion target [Streptomyces taklimakanensis]